MELKTCKCFWEYTAIFWDSALSNNSSCLMHFWNKYYDRLHGREKKSHKLPAKQLHLKVCLSTAHLEQIKSWITFLKTSCRPTCLGNDGAEGWDGCYLNESAAVMRARTQTTDLRASFRRSSSLSITSKFNNSSRKTWLGDFSWSYILIEPVFNTYRRLC